MRRDPTLLTAGAATLLVLVVFCTMITTIAPTARSLNAGLSGQTWALGAISLGLAGTLLTAGALGDAIGRRRVFVAAAAALAAASALAAAAPTMPVFVVARVLQGAAGAGLMATGLGMIGSAYPDGAARTRATGVWAGMLGGGILLGPLIGALGELAAGWRSVHVVEAVAAAGLVVAGRRLPESRAAGATPRLDLPGAAVFLVAMTCLMGGLVAGRTDWTAALTLALFAGAALAIVTFAAVETRRPEPMLALALARGPVFVVASVGAAVTGLTTIALMTYAPLMLQRDLGHTALAAAAIIAVWSLTSMLVAMQARRLPERIDARHRLVAGLLLTAAGLAGLASLQPGDSWWGLAPGLFVLGVGSGVANAAVARLAVAAVPPARAALGSGANNTARYLGSGVGVAAVVVIVTAGGTGTADLLDGWNLAVVAGAGLNVAGAALALVTDPR